MTYPRKPRPRKPKEPLTEAQKAILAEQRKKYENQLETQMRMMGRGFIPQGWVREHRFHEPERGEKRRQFRADFAWPEHKLLIEVEGLTNHTRGGGHQNIKGYRDDLEKYNLATLQGWRILRFEQTWINPKHGGAINTIVAWFAKYRIEGADRGEDDA